MTNLEKLRDQEAEKYGEQFKVYPKCYPREDFNAGWDARDKIAQEHTAKLVEALEFYAKHESVIKEAYHSNDEKQITCVHTFINHRAIEALADHKRMMEGD